MSLEENVMKSQLSKRLHHALNDVLVYADPGRYAPYWVRREGFSDEQLPELQRHVIAEANGCISAGAKLDTYYRGNKMPLNLAMEICLVTGDATIFNAMVQRAANPATINMQGDFECTFIETMTAKIPDPKKLDDFLTLLETQKGGKKLLTRTWPAIAEIMIAKYSRHFALAPRLKTFQAHGYDIKGVIREENIAALISDFERNLDWFEKHPNEPKAIELKPVLEEMLAHYKGTEVGSPNPKVIGDTLDAAAVERVEQPEKGRTAG